ncbi:SDR family NAD(P)-dependent oxidoreductase [Rubrivivax gelatinosus]|uniref:SDR family NAD(P)-dependent oxidoreductase n=1 Tax=Rubrivivax gelatinosus TaxID=28068 RepID=UPI0002F8EA5C|nr:SDR family NAD(P)-dependent oxidoreductase [Rubrivivax gelatinosus]MBG6082885.1 NAD(P)-dependent dehydrogenase (short-subunit alcohol dehydrogenase family) [Rubrivivax gelatinosus]
MAERVLVTGGSHGLGRAMVDRLRADGYRVVNLDLQPAAAPHAGEVFVQADLTDEAGLRAALAAVIEREGPITRLVNNAGIVRPASFEQTELADLQAVMALNVGGSIVCAQALLPGMKAARFGRIVHVSSRAALGKATRSAYAASKAALHGLAKTMALELGPYGVTVNAIGPGPIASPLFDRVNPPGAPATQQIVDAIPLRRMGQPAEVAHMVASLLDARAGFVTGQVLYVCGGMTVGLAA